MRWKFRRRRGAPGPAVLGAVIAAVLPAAAACTAPGAAGRVASANANATMAASAAAGSPSWGKAEPVPGLAGLNAGGDASVGSVSCASGGNCVAGGSYKDGHGHYQAFLVGERNRRWGAAIEVPGTARLNAGGNASTGSVSCGSAGNCAASGGYLDRSGVSQGFVAVERNGRWGAAIEVPGAARVHASRVWGTSVTCAKAGNCAARGFYTDANRHTRLFLTSERNGRWRVATAVPGTVGGVRASVYSMWCDSRGTCEAGGSYTDSKRHVHAFVASERNARWEPAVDVLRTTGLNVGGNAGVNAVSCASAGNCAAGGYYKDRHGHFDLFVVSQRNGRWGKAIEIPGIARLNVDHFPQVSSVSCARAGNCEVGGAYVDRSGNRHAFVVSERAGRWGTAIEVPGTRARAWGTSLSCGSAGNCAASGGYVDSAGHNQPFVAIEQNGRWRTAIEVPGIAELDASTPGHGGSAAVVALSCVRTGYCVAGGYYDDYFNQTQAFVVSRQ